jgi:amidase
MKDAERVGDGKSGLDRREFLRRSGWVGAALAAGGAGLWRAGLAGAQGAAPVAPAVPGLAPGGFELEEATVAGLREAMRSGRHTARSIAELYLGRIEAVDRRGPALSAVIEQNPDALATADALDAELRGKGPRGPLHGIPVLLKDNIDTADRMHTSAGSLALAEQVAARDAFLVERLRAAGALILGKTNLSEWANFRSTHSTSGWSGRGGQTRNPYALDRNPCGSSSGSGAAVSANLTALAVGTETDGSVVCPASTCGVVGVKPTVGLVSRSGIVPISHTQDTAGPMARTVTDAALLLGALAGADPRDAATGAAGAVREADYTRFLDAAGLQGARLGVARNFFGFSQAVDRAMADALGALKDAGAVLVDPANLETSGKYDNEELEVLLYEFKSDLNAYLAQAGPGAAARTLAELIQFDVAHQDREMPFFGQELFEQAEAKGPLTAPAYKKALEKCRRLSRDLGIDALMRKHRLDAIVAPTNGPAWTTDLVNGDHFSGGSSSPAAVAGYPSVTVPAGLVHGLPVGISFFGRAWSEGTLLRLAFAFEQATKARRIPTLAPSLAY